MADAPLFGETDEPKRRRRREPVDTLSSYDDSERFYVDCPGCEGRYYSDEIGGSGKPQLCMVCRGLGKVVRTARQLAREELRAKGLTGGSSSS